MLKRSVLKAPPGSKTRVVRSARSFPGATVSAVTLASMRAWPAASSLPSKIFWRSVSYFRVGSSKTYSSKRLNEVRAGERASSTSALRLRAGAPWSHAEVRTPEMRLFARSWSVPKSIAILSRLGITVSTLSVLSNVAPPTLTRPV